MRVRLVMVLWWRLLLAGLTAGLVPVASLADTAPAPLRPAEEPPSDFAAPQYIDSTGCVFLRDGVLWQPRLSREGTLVCGYPPTPVGPAASRVPLSVPVLDGMGRIEATLLTTITAGLAPGELASDPRSAPSAEASNLAGQDAPDPPEDSGPSPATQIAAGVAATAAIRAAAAGRDAPNARLCALLGLDPASAQGNAIGGDPTGGLCAAPQAGVLVPRVTAAASGAAAVLASPAPRPAAQDRPSRSAAAARQDTKGQAPRMIAKVPARDRAAPAPPVRAEALIPAGARYLQVTRQAADFAPMRSRLVALGLPVARGQDSGGETLLAGPFPSRQTIVTAHDRLTRAGFRNIVPR